MRNRHPGRNAASFARARAEAEAAAAGRPLPPLPGTKKARPRHIEDTHQEALFEWAAASGRAELELLYAIPNGGARKAFEAERLRRQGVKAGVLDMHLPIANPSGGWGGPSYLGLWIELKRPWVTGEKNQYPSDDQKRWMSALQRAGHCVVLAYGWDQAREAIEAYLDGHAVPHQWSPKQ